MQRFKIEFYALAVAVDDHNERDYNTEPAAISWAERTDSGGRQNLYASRITKDNEVTFTIHYRDGLEESMLIKQGSQWYRIISIKEEGRRYKLHIITTTTDDPEDHD